MENDAHPDAPTVADGGAAAPAAAVGVGGTVPAAEAFDPVLGTHIGRYKLLQKIGEGGWGVVYMAEQEEPVRRRLALKIIKLGMDTRSVIARFEAERQALAMMDHPNIARVLDAGATDSGRPFFVMELVRGISVTSYCDQHSLPMEERLRLFIQVCQAVQHAHQKGIIHRDLKPSNILVSHHDGRPVPKIIDFGIAKASEARLTDKTLFTAFEQFIGTPAYMSPEQAEMSSLDIDTRSDIYSLGVLLYELLTGRTPFASGELAQAGIEGMRRMIREMEPSRPSTRLQELPEPDVTRAARRRQVEPSRLAGLVRGDLDWIVMKAIDKDRTRRYATANELAADVERFLKGEPIVARPPSRMYKLRKLARRHRMAAGAAAVTLTALTAGLALAVWQYREKNAAWKVTRDAEVEKSRLLGEARKAQAVEASLRTEAERQGLAARQRSYAADINLAQQALAVNNLGRAQELLAQHRPTTAQPDDLRGWEWFYLWQQCQSEASYTLDVVEEGVRSIAVSGDGRWAAGEVGRGSEIVVWDLQSRRESLRLNQRESALNPGRQGEAAGTPPDGSRLPDSGPPPNGGPPPDSGPPPDKEPADGAPRSGEPGKSATVQKSSGVTPLNQPAPAQAQSGPVAEPEVPAVAGGRSRGAGGAAASGRAEGGPSRRPRPIWENRIAFAPKGDVLAFAVSEGGPRARESHSIRVCSAANGSVTAEWPFESAVVSMAFAPDGGSLLVITADARASMVDPATGAVRSSTSLPVEGRWLPLMRPSADLQRLALAESNGVFADGGQVRVIDTASGAPRWTMETSDPLIRALAFSPDGSVLAAGVGSGGEATVRLWDGATGVDLGRLDGHRGQVSSLVFGPDGQWLASASDDHTIRLWDVKTRRLLAILRGHRSSVRCLALMPDATTLLSAGADGDVLAWDTRRLQGQQTQFVLNAPVKTWTFAENGGSMVTLGTDGRISRWLGSQFQAEEVVAETGPIADGLSPARFSHDGQFLAIANGRGFGGAEAIAVWDVRRGARCSEIRREGGRLGLIGFVPGTAELLTDQAGPRRVITRWDARTGTEVATWQAPDTRGRQPVPAFSSDGQWLVTADEQGRSRWRQLVLGEDVDIDLSLKDAQQLAFSPDGQLLAAVGESGSGQLWDASSRLKLTDLSGFLGGMHSAAFSPDSRRLAVGSGGVEAIKVYDVASQRELVTLEAVGQYYNQTQFSPDGKLLAASNIQGVLTFWRAPEPESSSDGPRPEAPR